MLNSPFSKKGPGKFAGMIGANAGKTLDAPTSPFARFRSKMQPGPRPGLPSVLGNLFQGAASPTPDAGPSPLAGLMQNGIAGAGPMQAAPEGPGMMGSFAGMQTPPSGLAALLARIKAQQGGGAPPMSMAPPMPPTNGGY